MIQRAIDGTLPQCLNFLVGEFDQILFFNFSHSNSSGLGPDTNDTNDTKPAPPYILYTFLFLLKGLEIGVSGVIGVMI